MRMQERKGGVSYQLSYQPTICCRQTYANLFSLKNAPKFRLMKKKEEEDVD